MNHVERTKRWQSIVDWLAHNEQNFKGAVTKFGHQEGVDGKILFQMIAKKFQRKVVWAKKNWLGRSLSPDNEKPPSLSLPRPTSGK